MARSFSQLAINAEKQRTSLAVSKKPTDQPELEIHTLGNSALRQSAKRISKVDKNIRDLVKKMLHSMYAAKGIGLAAPQIGSQQQLLVIDLDIENSATPPIILINPEITEFSATIDTYEEGCLSIPGVYLDVIRPSSIKVNFRDEMGRPKKINADGLLARCIQHEMDHLNGVLFVDRAINEEALNKELKEHGFKKKDVLRLCSD
ncbi:MULTISPECIES: peptide deformylase [Prochlorococcus]|uniref:Peptide deformylase n=1 Tax=Prochlorococcus marinus (strain SARG / CCMP1375 / SS120) TaxID=167539 RepID=DEF_PROMA|nr:MULTISPECIES: peptide deformylase [Prochlorococcus]Q7VED2.1 RecName: Full=Peptide deformylase; Short=PDF; AltName: Full=Polypeptide deformylase [Prochlorococcus marinus subsp. marinus str. CCMP1375]AAP99127.1 N-formylmethionyl-tRNA deformylase [Prochlorococcus marinus subsp. marinus str. CCMP1375]KGG11604.1 Peptide deformylase [Prochlorococcus marinus str. LG]KGG22379.1 Peptide deformylase [Prochlorococcus marinus str. SS2]KGG22715.1 Peptide deformylase [Prochlorococcus marinus str. SS35]K